MSSKFSKFYKNCVVPLCKSTTIKTPNKLFIYVPNQENIRKKWLKLARHDPKHFANHSKIYFCEDHFDLPKDMVNYIEYSIMGSVSVVRMKPGCLPSKFECQPDRRKRTCSSVERPYILKKQRMMVIEECLKEPEESHTQSLAVVEDTSDAVSVISDLHTFEENAPEAHKTDKSGQVNITHKFIIKDVQTNTKLADQALAPKTPVVSISSSPTKVAYFKTSRPFESGPNKFSRIILMEKQSDSFVTLSVTHPESSSSSHSLLKSTSDCSELVEEDRQQQQEKEVERELVQTPLLQYRTVINELREDISRLKHKVKDACSSSRTKEDPQIEEVEVSKEEAAEHAAHLKSLREAIGFTFKQQIHLRRRLIELDSHLLGLALDAERQHAAILHWEARFNRLYKPINIPGSRLSTQQSYSGSGLSSSGSERAEAEVKQAWAEQEAARADRDRVERQLEQVRLRGAQLEQELPARISSGPEREMLALVCRVHELEADNLALQGERAARAHELRRRDLALQRRDAQGRLSDEIITRQRRSLQEMGIDIAPELAQLYELYQQECHAATSTESNHPHTAPHRLPPISTSMSELTWSESSSGSGRDSSSGSGGTLALEHRLPRLPRLTPRPRTRYQ